MAHLALSLLGPFQASLDAKPVAGFKSKQVRALLAYLAVEAARPHSRIALAALLWPNCPDRAALNNLRYALSNLRQAIGDAQAHPPFLLIHRDTLQFNLDRDIDAAAQDVQAAISLAIRSLPKNMPTPPSFRKVNPADQPVLYLALSSPTLPLSAVDEYAQTLIARRISTISGVAQVNVNGSQKYAVRAQLDPKAPASRQIGIDAAAPCI